MRVPMLRLIEGPIRFIWVCVAFAAVACSDNDASGASNAAAPEDAKVLELADGGVGRSSPDLGGVTKVHVLVDGVGATLPSAIDQALALAVKQVNGVSVDQRSAKLDVATTVASTFGDFTFDARTFADLVEVQTSGIVTDFELVEKVEQRAVSGGTSWRVKIAANVATYMAPVESQRPTLVVARPRVTSSTFELGDRSRPAHEVQDELRSRINVALTATQRFAVLDREFTHEIESELALLASGAAAPAESVRLGQSLVADLIVVPSVEVMEYRPSSKKLRLSERELISYSGGARVAFQVINVATRHIVMQETYAVDFPTTAPTTLGATVDGIASSDEALSKLTDEFVGKLLRKTFPVSVISLSGSDVVLSQGAGVLTSGHHYRAVVLGAPLRDPQTGQTIGRSDNEFGTISIVRADAGFAYGRIETLVGSLPADFRPGMIELREKLEQSDVSRSGANEAKSPKNGFGTADLELLEPMITTPKKLDKDW